MGQDAVLVEMVAMCQFVLVVCRTHDIYRYINHLVSSNSQWSDCLRLQDGWLELDILCPLQIRTYTLSTTKFPQGLEGCA